MVPDWDDGHAHVGCSETQIQNKEKEVSQIIEANAVVDPRTVVVHNKHTPVADRAVVRSGGLHLIALVALLWPEFRKLRKSLLSVSKKSLHVATQPCEFIFSRVLNINLILDWLSVLSLFLLLPQLFDFSHVNCRSWFQNRCKHMIPNDIVE